MSYETDEINRRLHKYEKWLDDLTDRVVALETLEERSARIKKGDTTGVDRELSALGAIARAIGETDRAPAMIVGSVESLVEERDRLKKERDELKDQTLVLLDVLNRICIVLGAWWIEPNDCSPVFDAARTVKAKADKLDALSAAIEETLRE